MFKRATVGESEYGGDTDAVGFTTGHRDDRRTRRPDQPGYYSSNGQPRDEDGHPRMGYIANDPKTPLEGEARMWEYYPRFAPRPWPWSRRRARGGGR